jgi:hypothetical protein
MKKFFKHFGFAILYVIVLLIIGFAPYAIFDSKPNIPAILFYCILWATWGALLAERIIKWRNPIK